MYRSSRPYLLALFAGCALAVVAPRTASAHEKWFVDPGRYPVRWELLFSLPVAASVAVALLALGALLLLRRLVRDPLYPNPPWLQPINPSIQAVLGIQTAISLVYMAVQGWLLAPTLNVGQTTWGLLLLGAQLFVSFSFVTGWLTRLGGAALMGLVLAAFALFPFERAAEQLIFVGIGVYFLIRGRGLFLPATRLARRSAIYWLRYSGVAMPALRVFTGLSVMWLAFSEKLLNPALALAFLREYPSFNFMQLLGFSWFSDELFVYAAGAVELTIGLLLAVGVLPRIVILFMWVPFNMTIPLLPPQELLGHLPILAVMYAVFLTGGANSLSSGEPLSRGSPARAAVR